MKNYYFSILPSEEQGKFILRIIKKKHMFSREYEHIDISCDMRQLNFKTINLNYVLTYLLRVSCYAIRNKKSIYRYQWSEYNRINLFYEDNLTIIDHKLHDIVISNISASTIKNILSTQKKYNNCNVIDLNSIDEHILVVDPDVENTDNYEILKADIYAYNGTKYAKIYKKYKTIVRHDMEDIKKRTTEEIRQNVILHDLHVSVGFKYDFVVVSDNVYFLTNKRD